ncbi:hypothetical protein F511_17128 [Dorcoceras hygrometricum]|uniref:Uncharacterized protein n=1 Tax=Dorcoceras hygrometricum TaxID=472368 RepID=A0A2Z7CUQ6_9LAMI|nr:hypothetical protein F511_17128 [Dorcoceras hygrometricum]
MSGQSTRSVLGKWVYLVTLVMSLFDLQDVCIVIGSLANLDLPRAARAWWPAKGRWPHAQVCAMAESGARPCAWNGAAMRDIACGLAPHVIVGGGGRTAATVRRRSPADCCDG